MGVRIGNRGTEMLGGQAGDNRPRGWCGIGPSEEAARKAWQSAGWRGPGFYMVTGARRDLCLVGEPGWEVPVPEGLDWDYVDRDAVGAVFVPDRAAYDALACHSRPNGEPDTEVKVWKTAYFGGMGILFEDAMSDEALWVRDEAHGQDYRCVDGLGCLELILTRWVPWDLDARAHAEGRRLLDVCRSGGLGAVPAAAAASNLPVVASLEKGQPTKAHDR